MYIYINFVYGSLLLRNIKKCCKANRLMSSVKIKLTVIKASGSRVNVKNSRVNEMV